MVLEDLVLLLQDLCVLRLDLEVDVLLGCDEALSELLEARLVLPLHHALLLLKVQDFGVFEAQEGIVLLRSGLQILTREAIELF